MASLAQLIEDFNASAEFRPPADWSQGRTTYGGLSAALALQAALRDGPDLLPPLKSAQILFVGPVSGSLRFQARILRQGRSTTSIGVDVLSGPDVALRAAFIFASPRPTRVHHDFSGPPAVPAPADCLRIPAAGPMPAFLGNFEMRPAGGSMPVSGSGNPEIVSWVRHADAAGVDPAVALVALGDALPPAVMSCLTEFAPLSSMNWTVDLPQPAQEGDWFLLRSSSRQAAGGYSFQVMEVWDEQRRLVLSGVQTVAVFA